MWIFVLLAFNFLATNVAEQPSSSKTYRSDYVYNRKTDAFYKLHIDVRRINIAKIICQAEGASLMVPSKQQDVTQLHSMMKRYPDLSDIVYVGNDGMEHEDAEERPLIDLTQQTDEEARETTQNCDVVNRKGEIETTYCYQRLPFICKVTANQATYDEQCGTFGRDYNYNATVGSCYKVASVAMTWNEAFSECQSEGAHLAVLNSQAERDAVWRSIRQARKAEGTKAAWFTFIGFRADGPVVGNVTRSFKTIFNQTLAEAGFESWSENEPNNFKDKEDCGSLFSNDGKFNDCDCSNNHGFVCEKEVHT